MVALKVTRKLEGFGLSGICTCDMQCIHNICIHFTFGIHIYSLTPMITYVFLV